MVEKEHRAQLSPMSARTAVAPRQLGAAATFLGPATLVVLVMLAAPVLLLLRFSLNRYDLKELMIEMVTPENFLRFVTDNFYLEVLRTTVLVAVI